MVRSLLRTAGWSGPAQAQRGVDRSLIAESDGGSGLLDRESQLGSGSVALRLRVDASEGQVDAWTSVVVLLRHLMLDKAQVIFFFWRV